MVTKNCALDLAKFKIRVNAVCPGDTFTPAMHNELVKMVKDGWDYEEAYQFCADLDTEIGRLGAPYECAAAIHFLASDEASFVTGEKIVVDAGRVLHR